MKRVICVEGDIGTVTLRTVVGIVMTEITGVGVAVAVAVVWRTGWMVLWLVPLVLKLISAMCSVPREGLVLDDGDVVRDRATAEKGGRGVVTKKFLITSGHGFQIIEGPPRIVLQFFRHYGHPRRSRWNEIVQIAVVVAFGLNFPVGLVVSVMCMPLGLQCVWTGYVLYVTVVMYVSRYAHGQWWLTTEERIADALVYAEEHPGEAMVLFKGGDDCTLTVELTRTTHDSHGGAKEHAMQLLQPSPIVRQGTGDSQLERSSGDKLVPQKEGS
ncbi:hypothetical protein BO71DRAFT_435621 [Aspergillus ellipticus CBS 707.79]|uniref:Uncharacterized protein n=1 Tax=Aspergillus ellipticus CBS 707.79 TaxID=1448320 RepID=A0A319DC15_9EURO|nr:hypothetical protein BO71DRAFT_435621 [Aspergillus ellipticus CBS 707.79]